MNNYCLIYITCSSFNEAKNLSKALLEDNLIACANIFPNGYSLYKLEGKLIENNESIIIAKTTNDLFDKVSASIKTHHSYTIPCILKLKIEDGEKKFLKWIENSINCDIISK